MTHRDPHTPGSKGHRILPCFSAEIISNTHLHPRWPCISSWACSLLRVWITSCAWTHVSFPEGVLQTQRQGWARSEVKCMCEIQNEEPEMPFDFAGDLTAIIVKRTKKDMTDWQIIKEIHQIIKSTGQKVNGSRGKTCQLTTQEWYFATSY